MTVDLDFSLFWARRNGSGSPDLWDVVVIDGEVMPGVARIESIEVGRKTDTRSPPGADGANYRDKGREPAKFVVSLELRTPAQLTRWTELVDLFDYRTEAVPIPPGRPQTKTEADAEKRRRDAATQTELERRTQAASDTQEQAHDWSTHHEAFRGGQNDAPKQVLTTPTRRQRRPMSITHPMASLQNIQRVYVDKVRTMDPRSGKGLLRVELHCLEYRPLPLTAAHTASGSATPDAPIYTGTQTAIGSDAPSNTQAPNGR